MKSVIKQPLWYSCKHNPHSATLIEPCQKNPLRPPRRRLKRKERAQGTEPESVTDDLPEFIEVRLFHGKPLIAASAEACLD